MKKKKTVEYYMSLPYRLEIYPDAVEGGYTARSECRRHFTDP